MVVVCCKMVVVVFFWRLCGDGVVMVVKCRLGNQRAEGWIAGLFLPPWSLTYRMPFVYALKHRCELTRLDLSRLADRSRYSCFEVDLNKGLMLFFYEFIDLASGHSVRA